MVQSRIRSVATGKSRHHRARASSTKPRLMLTGNTRDGARECLVLIADSSTRVPLSPKVRKTLDIMTCLPVFGPIIAGKFQFSGMCDSGRWTRKDHEEIEVYGGADCLHPAAGRGRHSGR